MSNIQTGAERMPHDLSHLGFLAGPIGRLITISTTPVIAGDSFAMADVILNMNQDGMLRRSESLRRRSEQVQRLTVFGVIAALGAGLWFSSRLTTRALRPVSVLSQAVRRLGQGDLEARALVEHAGEIGQLRKDFNAMAGRLKSYRESSLGELLQAQQASQAAIHSLPDPAIVFGLKGGILNVNQSPDHVLGFSL